MKARKRFIIDCRGYKLVLGEKTRIMGVLNVTPDSFSDGGEFFDIKKAVKRGIEIEGEGADIIDIGGESTRPYSNCVSALEQIKRVAPVITVLKKKIKIPISIDTSNSRVAEEAVKAGAKIINDITGLGNDKDIARVAAKYKTGLCIMHIKGSPQNMQDKASYKNLMQEICAWLNEGVRIAMRAGVSEKRIIIDPGIGFAKTTRHNLQILNNLYLLNDVGRPILIGPSRKSFIGKILNKPVNERLIGTIAASVIAIANGAHIVRVHDIKEIKQAAMLADAILKI